MEPSTPESLDDLLKKLLRASPEVEAEAIVSNEGLPIASTLPQGVKEAKIAAMASVLLSVSEKAIGEMNKGEFDQLSIKGSSGYLLILKLGSNVILILSASQDVSLGSIRFFTRFLGSAGASGLVV